MWLSLTTFSYTSWEKATEYSFAEKEQKSQWDIYSQKCCITHDQGDTDDDVWENMKIDDCWKWLRRLILNLNKLWICLKQLIVFYVHKEVINNLKYKISYVWKALSMGHSN